MFTAESDVDIRTLTASELRVEPTEEPNICEVEHIQELFLVLSIAAHKKLSEQMLFCDHCAEPMQTFRQRGLAEGHRARQIQLGVGDTGWQS
jgi:hypothetical protein